MKRPQREFENEVRTLFNQYSYENFGRGTVRLSYFFKRDDKILTQVQIRLYDTSRKLITQEQEFKTSMAGIIFNIDGLSTPKQYCHITALYLKEGYRSFGIGRETVQKIEEIAKKSQCKRIELTSRNESIKFWKNVWKGRNFSRHEANFYVLNLEERTA